MYYIGLLAGVYDMELLARSRVGRDINRHYYTPAEIGSSLQKPVVQKLLELIRLRNIHQAFAAHANIETQSDQTLVITWNNAEYWARLFVDLSEPRALLTHSNLAAEQGTNIGAWDSRHDSLLRR